MDDEFPFVPDYGGGCISDIPGSVKELFGIESSSSLDEDILDAKDIDDIEKVVIFVLDGLSYTDLLRIIPEDSIFSKEDFERITSVFPTTTAVGITSLNTGREPVEHGLIEWEVWDENFEVVQPIISMNLEDESVNISKFFEGETVYSELSEQGVSCSVFQPIGMIDSEFSKELTDGAERLGYNSLFDLFVNLREFVDEEGGRGYFYVYIPLFDSLSHEYGPSSEQATLMIKTFFRLLEEVFISKLEDDAFMMITADHGLEDISGREIVDISLNEEVWNVLETEKGSKILPSGGPKDMFLKVKNIDRAREVFKNNFGEICTTYRFDELVEKGVFGKSEPSNLFYERAGDVIVLPEDNRLVYYSENHEHINEMKGMHGGVSDRECFVPFYGKRVSGILKEE